MDFFTDDTIVERHAPWDQLRTYRVRQSAEMLVCGPGDDLFDGEPEVSFAPADVVRNPFTFFAFLQGRGATANDRLVVDLACTLIRDKGLMPVDELLHALGEEDRLSHETADTLECTLRCCVASGIFEATVDRRTKDSCARLRLSPNLFRHENMRTFAATFASELSSLSERVKLLISHPSSVGTYRETLLQSLLRRSLPERYHVATGFIYGCDRQIDVLIYDRLDYAPLFREGDLVVVPRQAVRAAIEVKTTLNSEQLLGSLKLISKVAGLDDAKPPFFKGIFAFDTSMKEESMLEAIGKFHKPCVGGSECHTIYNPYEHVSCVCVLGKSFAFVDYQRDQKGRFFPVLKKKASVSGLPAQASYFLQMLLDYLRYQALKPGAGRELDTMLGSDTRVSEVGRLPPSPEWGAYFDDDSDDEEYQRNINEMETILLTASRWLNQD